MRPTSLSKTRASGSLWALGLEGSGASIFRLRRWPVMASTAVAAMKLGGTDSRPSKLVALQHAKAIWIWCLDLASGFRSGTFNRL